MKNKLSDLHNHLFMEIERLGDEDLKGDELAQEIGRAKAVCDVARHIISNGRLVLDAAKAADDIPGLRKISLPLLE
jgi:hypothetical protein